MVRHSIRDARWLTGVEPVRRSKREPGGPDPTTLTTADHTVVGGGTVGAPALWNFDEMMKNAMVEEDESVVFCSSCGTNVPGAERWQLSAHYGSGWHRANVRRCLRGKDPLGEEEWEERVEGEEEEQDGADGAHSSDDDSDSSTDVECGDYTTATSGGARAYFVHDAAVYSVYSALLRDGETSVPSTLTFFSRPLNCAIILLAGGHFAAGIFENDRLVVHRAIHRYVVRAKQGGAQSANDKSKGNAKSAGANLRRYNERVMREEIRGVLAKEWLIHLAATPLIFLRCASYQRGIFVSDDDADAPIRKGDARLRTIPFETKRPLVDEVKRTWERLGEVHEHGSIEDFEKEMEERRERARRRQTALQRKGRRDQKDSEWTVDDEKAAEEDERRREERRLKRKEMKEQIRRETIEQKKAADPHPDVTSEMRQSIYAAVRDNDGEGLRRLLGGDDEMKETLLKYVRTVRLPPSDSSLLHVAAQRGADQSIKYLLSLECSAAVKNADGLVPYSVCDSKLTRAIFSQWRADKEAEEEDEEDDGNKEKKKEKIQWNMTQIPLPVEKSAAQLAKEAERRKAKRDRTKAKQKVKKEEERKEAEEQAKKAAYLALSDREKRALAAEARMAAMTSCVVRCFQCAATVTGTPFEYGANRFCSTACVANHRAKNTV